MAKIGLGDVIDMPVNYNRQYHADITKEVPGESYYGLTRAMEPFPKKQTALCVMHVWNTGLDPNIPWGADSPVAGWWRAVEYVGRAMSITQNVLPGVMDTTRAVGIPLIHIATPNHSYPERFPQYSALREEAGAEPPKQEGAVGPNWREWYGSQMWSSENAKDIRKGAPHLDFAEDVVPKEGEHIACTSHELNHLCRREGIWNLVYVGFALNWCLWFSPCGMVDMNRLGYRCSTIRGATTAVEFRDTARDQKALEYAYWHTATMFGYVIDLDDYMSTLSQFVVRWPDR
ncbi:MAG: isochorismatase family protein [Candidatus Latescibacteria bacterium]|nr:isochorismatase family protein [Candidatus Latescibacterota bacterium]